MYNFYNDNFHNNFIKITMKAEILFDKPIPMIYKQLAELDSIKSINIHFPLPPPYPSLIKLNFLTENIFKNYFWLTS